MLAKEVGESRRHVNVSRGRARPAQSWCSGRSPIRSLLAYVLCANEAQASVSRYERSTSLSEAITSFVNSTVEEREVGSSELQRGWLACGYVIRKAVTSTKVPELLGCQAVKHPSPIRNKEPYYEV